MSLPRGSTTRLLPFLLMATNPLPGSSGHHSPRFKRAEYSRLQLRHRRNRSLSNELPVHQDHRRVPSAVTQRLPDVTQPRFHFQLDWPLCISRNQRTDLRQSEIAFDAVTVDFKKPFLPRPTVDGDFHGIPQMVLTFCHISSFSSSGKQLFLTILLPAPCCNGYPEPSSFGNNVQCSALGVVDELE